MVDPAPYDADAERIRRHLVERYVTAKRFGETSGREYSYFWLQDSAKNKYKPNVNIHNWFEDRSDINYIKKQLPPEINEFTYAYKTEHKCRFGESNLGGNVVPKRRAGCSFPGHQPELGPPLPKEMIPYHSETRTSFQHPCTAVAKPPRRKK